MFARRMPPLMATRSFASGGVLMWIVFGVLLGLVKHDVHPTKGVLAVAAFGALELLWIVSIARRPLPAADAKTVRAFAIQTFFVGFALAEATVLMGFVAYFVARRGQFLLYLTSLPLGFVGLVLISPTRARLARIQVRMKELGSAESAVEILNRPPDAPRVRSKRARRRR